jgi:hypothetical protein
MSTRDRRAYWFEFHQECVRSGDGVAEFCRYRGVRADTYRQAVSRYGFKRKFKAKQKAESNFIELTSSDTRNCLVEVEYRSFTIRLFSKGDIEIFTETLRSLEELS